MSARAIGSGTVSFGLVSIPVKVYSCASSGSQLSFNMLHGACKTRVKQQYVCPSCEVTVPRGEMIRGYEFARGQFVALSDDEHKALLEVATNAIELSEFVPAESVNAVYYDKPFYLGPDKGGDRAYRLLADAMTETGLVGLAKYAARGKQYLVMVRPEGTALVMQQLHYADEIRPLADVSLAETPAPKPDELSLAVQIIRQIAGTAFVPESYQDDVKTRMLELIDAKVAGEEITAVEAAPAAGQIIDLMEALKASVARAEGNADKAPARKPAKAARRAKGAPAKSATETAPAKKRASRKTKA
ncbi:MAG TPA: Ku protein [Kofleriaceae bacterium]|nr:Ku protein [Kofleriaceae bacterium]